MPLYAYVCKCGAITESREGVGVITIPCPACEKRAVRDLPRNVALHGLPTRGSHGGADH